MHTRIGVAGLAVALIALFAIPAVVIAEEPATRDVRESVDALPSASWMMKVTGRTYGNGRIKELTYRRVAKMRKAAKASWTDPVTNDIYYGVPLKRLVGLVDDNKPGSFNGAKAAANKYSVTVKGVDGFSYTWSSADVATLDILVATHYRAGGVGKRLVLPLGEARAITGPPEEARWIPTWPAKLVGDEPSTSGRKRIGGVNRVMLTAPLAPT